MIAKNHKQFYILSAISFILALGAVPHAFAASYYWDTTTTGTWQTGSNWSTSPTGSPAGTVAPSSSITADTAVFNGSGVNGVTTVQTTASVSILGITFNNTGTTAIASSSTTNRTITIGGSGITMAATAGNVTFDLINKASVTVGANQTWTINNAASTLSGFNNLTINANTLQLAGVGNFDITADISTTAAGILNADQSGILTLRAGNGNTAFLGTLNTGLNGGTVLLSNITSLNNAALVNIKGGTIASISSSARTLSTPNVSVTGDFTLGQAATGTGAVTILGGMDLNNATRQITTANSDDILSGVISNGGLTKAGTGTLTLSGSGANTYTGLTTVGAGGLTLAKTSVNAIAGNVLVNGTGTLTLGAVDQIINTSNVEVAAGILALATFNETVNGVKLTGGTITGTTGVLTSSTAYDFQSSGNVTGILAGTAGANKTTSGTVTFTGGNANTYTGLTTVSAGTLSLNRTAGVDALASNVLVNGTGTLTINSANQIKDTASVEVAAGTLAISGNAETVNGVKLTGGAITGSGSASVLTSTTAFDFQSGSSTAVLSGTAGVTKTTGGTVSLGRASTYSGGTTLTDGTLQIASASSGSVGSIISSGIGTGTLNLNGGTLSSGSGTARTLLNDVTVGGNVILGDAANNGKLTFSADVDLGGSARTLTTASAINFDGVVSNGGISKAGAGNLTLGGANTYSGLTTIDAGTLTVAGSITSSSVVNGGLLNVNGTAGGVIVNTGGSLGGSGNVGAISGSGTVGPGNSPGILTATSVNPTAGTDFKFEFTSLNPTYTTATASGNDLLRLTASSSPFAGGTFTSGNIISIYLNSAAITSSLLAGTNTTFSGGFFVDGTYGLAEALNPASFAYYTTSAALGTGSAVDYNGTSYYALANTAAQITLSNTLVSDAGFAAGTASGTLLTFNAVPEPSTGALLGFGLGGLVLTRLMRRKQS